MGYSKKTPRLHLVSFGDSSIRLARKRLKVQAENLGVFETVALCDEHDLKPSFRRKHRELLNKQVRGFGFWIWKPQIVLQRLSRINDGDILVYCDIGFHLNLRGRERLEQWERGLIQSGKDFLVFQSFPPTKYPHYDGRALPDHRDAVWTKGDLLDHLDMRSNPSIWDPTIQAGLFFVRRSERALGLISKWRDVMSNHLNLIDDSPSISPNFPEFKEHRHDQSVFSLLMKKEGQFISESGFQFWYPQSEDVNSADWSSIADSPFQARRDKSRGRTPVDNFLLSLARLKRKVSLRLRRVETPRANPLDL